jgi:hypothetical protein
MRKRASVVAAAELAAGGEFLRQNSDGSTASRAGAQLALVPSGRADLVTEATLDAALVEVRRLRDDFAASGWALGRKLREIDAAGLWKFRTARGADGRTASAWKSFDAFIVGEANITPKMARSLMGLAADFTREQLRGVKITSALAIATAPAEDREPLLAGARDGDTTRETAKRVRDLRDAKGHRASNAGRPRKAPTVAPPPPSMPPRTVTAVVHMNESTAVEMFAGRSRTKRAHEVTEHPMGRFELANDSIAVTVRIEATAQGLVVHLLAKREDA